MFYESIGELLGQAAAALADDSEGPMDARDQRARRQVTTFVRRAALIWPKLFQSLAEETAILETSLRRAIEDARAHGLDPADERAERASTDPLTRYRELLCVLDEWVIRLHAHSSETWAEEALRSLRRGLADAAEVQGRLVDEMLGA